VTSALSSSGSECASLWAPSALRNPPIGLIVAVKDAHALRQQEGGQGAAWPHVRNRTDWRLLQSPWRAGQSAIGSNNGNFCSSSSSSSTQFTSRGQHRMGRNVIVAGTGFEGRASIIRRHCRNGQNVSLRREPNNEHDSNAIAVCIETPVLFGLLGKRFQKIGYIKAAAADGLAEQMDRGLKVTARVASFHAPSGWDHPRVSLTLGP
jgi:hypothetical protein